MSAGKAYDARVAVIGGPAFVTDELENALAVLASLEVVSDGPPTSGPFDVLVVDGAADRIALLEQVQREHPSAAVLVVVGDGDLPAVQGALRSEATELIPGPIAPEHLRERVAQRLEQRFLAAENRRMRMVLHTLEQCRSLIGCFDAGKVYSMALDLLLNTLSCTRGLAVFRRSAIPLGDAAVFRGLSEGEARRLREILVDDKPLELDGLSGMRVVERGPIHDALREVGAAVGTLLEVPLAGDENEAGAIWIFEDGRAFDEDERDRVALVVEYATAALRNCESYNRAKERAFIDDVTEAYNARYLLSTAENEIRRAERYEHPLSVLFLDLDRFKLVNDRFGHLIGSQTLRKLAQLLKQCVRQVDTLARYGGDEFTILLVDTGKEEAVAVARRIRETVESHVFEAGRDASLRVTISIGVATYPMDGTTRDTLLDAADKAMYRAKSQGRNQVCRADDL